MRVNSPITNSECEVRDGESVVSKTDLRGTITFATLIVAESKGGRMSCVRFSVPGFAMSCTRYAPTSPAGFESVTVT